MSSVRAADARRAALHLRVRLWFAAWAVCSGAVILALAATPWLPRNDVDGGVSFSAYTTTAAAVFASFTVRRRILRGDREGPGVCPSTRMRTLELAGVWSLDCVVALSGAALTAHSFPVGLCVALSGALLLILAPPKIAPDADLP